MGASKNEFNAHREKLLINERLTQQYKPFDHDKNFCKKVKENWLTTEKLTELCSCSDFMELTNALIVYKMHHEDATIIMSHLGVYEPDNIKGSEYILKVCESPLDNMKRVYKKYTECDTYHIRKTAKDFLFSEIKKKERLENGIKN